MHYKAIAAAALLFASIAAAQATRPPTQDKVFDFTNKPSPQGLQEIATVLRTVTDIQRLSIDAAASTITVNGNIDQLAMVGWVIRELDQPANIASVPTDRYLVPAGATEIVRPGSPGTGDDVIRVFFLQHTATPQGVQEMLTVLRTVADVRKIFNYSAPTALVARGPAAQIALAAYLVNALDVPRAEAATSPEFPYMAPGGNHEVVRVFHLAHVTTPQGIQEILTVLRTVADIQKIFTATAPMDLAIRGTASDIATSEWLIQSLDLPASPRASSPPTIREYHIPSTMRGDSVIRVFYPVYITTTAGLQQTLDLLRAKVRIMKAFNNTTPAALVVRGSADQIAQAEQLIRDRDQPIKIAP